ncbi:Trichosetin synthetase PKS-nrps1 [Aspergillus terreus]
MVSGKLDRKKLRSAVEPLPKDRLRAYGVSNAGPGQISETEATATLREIWEDVIGLESGSIGVEDNFFEIGGDSFSAMKLVSAANSHGISIKVVDIYAHPVFMDMARKCEPAKPAQKKRDVEPFSLLPTSADRDWILEEVSDQCCVSKESISDIYPCSPVQEGLLTLSVKEQGAYVAQPVFRLSEHVDLERFMAAWQTLVNELDILRTRIIHTDSLNFLQAVLKEDPISWRILTTFDDLIEGNFEHSNYAGGPLTGYAIVKDNASSATFFVWTVHHALYDGWMLPGIFRRVEEIYSGISRDNTMLQYKLFVDYLTGQQTSESDEFWKSYLSSLDSSPFPQNKSTSPGSVRVGNTHESSMQISEFSGYSGVTLPEMIRAAWAIVVSAHTGSSDVCFGETLMGRNIGLDGITDIAGPILTTVPTRIQVDNETSITQYLQNIHQLTVNMLPHQHAGLQRIRTLNSDTSLACEFQNILVIQSDEGKLNEDLWVPEGNRNSRDFFAHPLTVECKIAGPKLDITVHHDEIVLDSWTTEKVLHQFMFILEQLLALPAGDVKKVGDLDLSSRIDKESIAAWNKRIPFNLEKCVHDIIHEEMSKRPNAPAICAWDGQLSYAATMDLASSFAKYLGSRGVGPETLVPFCLDKSLWAVISILGILMAGGAFVPMDPSHPTSRHKEILEEVDARVILCSPHYQNRYAGLVKSIIPVSKETVKAYGSISKSVKRNVAVKPSNMAFAIFTSGSTGRPKGIVIDHQSLASSAMAWGPIVQMNNSSRVFQFASLTFDAAVMEVLATLMHGGCICIPSEDERLNDVAGAIQRMNVSWSFLTPSIASILEPSTVPSLKVLVCGGEKLSKEVVTKWAHRVQLMNGYGPTETTIFAVLNDASANPEPSCIGFGIPCTLTWIVDPDNHDRLSPLGAVGELVLEGPALAREYLKNPEKTADAFVSNLAWMKHFQNSQQSLRRIYKTGDLVKYNPDGSINCIGRKDHQVKLHGQRMELGEIEHRLHEDPRVRHAVVIMPKTGRLQQRLVTVLSLESLTMDKSVISNGACELVEHDTMKLAYRELTQIQKALEDQLPVYMVPQTWAVVKALPMLVSGKMDRKRITSWIENTDEATYDRIMQDYDNIKRAGLVDKKDNDEGSVVDTLRAIFVEVLNIPSHKVDSNRSFVSLGGDSITGMAVISKARKHGLSLTLHSILQSKSVVELALKSEKKVQTVQVKERLDEPFGLSPIQSLYFKTATEFGQSSHFNQGVTVRTTRARFVQSQDGEWQQRILDESASSYRLQTHYITNEHEISSRTSESQRSLDIHHGPVFAADVFELPSHRQILALVAHHLCVDMVSWRIVLQDLQEFIESGSLSLDKTLSFQNWCELQTTHAKESDPVRLPFNVQQPDLGYWGMENVRNRYGDAKMEVFAVNQEATSFVLRDCHHVFRTETVEVLLAAVISSFRRVFADREVPTIYNEGHGREAWDSSMDLSRTVGWFTTLAPMDVSGERADLVDTLKRVKDLRRSTSYNARTFFAQDLLSGGTCGSTHFPIPLEVIFNYLGQLQQLERDGSLFQHFEVDGANAFGSTSDMGPETPRFALFEVSAIIIKEQLHMGFTYNRHMKHMKDIQRWASECRRILEEDIPLLKDRAPQPTLSDYPLLPITYEGLENFMRYTLPKAEIDSWECVEDIYPCSPVQEGILLSQLRDPYGYMFHAIFEVRCSDKALKAEASRLKKAWSMVVARHQILRTLFVDSYSKGGAFDQLVVKELEDEILEFECDENIAFQTLDNIKLANINAKRLKKLPHQLTICTTTGGRVLLKIELNHVIIDGGSIDLLIRDLQLAYDNRLPSAPGPLFAEYIKFIKAKDHHQALDHWVRYLSGAHPCHLRVSPTTGGEKRLGSVLMQFDRFPELQRFCEENSVTLANLTLTAWAMVLRSFTGSDDVCFGYLTAGRDSPVPDIQNAVGIFINMLCCRVKFGQRHSLLDISKTVQEDFLGNLPYQNCSLAQIQHELGRDGQMLFNTALSIQNHSISKPTTDSTISLEIQGVHDPTEYPVTVNVETGRGREGVLIRYWSDAVSDSQAKGLTDAIAHIFTLFVENPHTSVTETTIRNQGPDRVGSDLPSRRISEVDEDYIRSLVDARVKEVIYQMLEDGVLAIPPFQGKSVCEDKPALKMHDRPFRETVIPKGIVSSDSVPTLTEDIKEPGDLEKRLWRLWSEALSLPADTVIRHASFFKLGGDSISAMKMVGAARQEGLMLSVADVFGNPVFEDMLATICSRSSNPSSTTASSNASTPEDSQDSFQMLSRTVSPQEVTIVRPVELDEASLQAGICPRIGLFKGGISDVLPVTDFQALSLTASLFKSRWMLNYFFLEGNGPLDIRRMTESFERVVDAFDILRTVFVCFHGQCFQVILRKLQPDIFIHETERSLEEYTASLQQRDREQVPSQGEQYVQFYIVKQKGTAHHRILIRMSHAQYDGVCLPRIMSAIKMGYEGCTIPPAPSFSNYIRMLPGVITPEHYQHWRKVLHGSKMTDVIRRHSPNSFQHIGAYAEQKRTIDIPATALDNVTIATVMQSAWALTLAKLSSQSDVVFGLTNSGRNAPLPGIESTVGPCLNITPVRVKFGEHWTGLDLIRYLQDQQVANMAYEILGFREIIRQCTSWPESTYFTTTLFHQSLEYEGEMKLDDHTYRMGGVGIVDNFVDLTVFSKQTSTQHLLVSLGYSLKGPVQPVYAAKVLDMVCETAQTLLANPSITLPSPTTLRSLPSQVINDVPRQSDEQFLSSNLNTRSVSEILVHSDMVNRIWQQVLPNKNPELPRPPFQLTSSFFELGGDILNMAQVVWLLEQEGLRVHLEDLLEHPTFLGHMAVLALHDGKQQQRAETRSSETPSSSLPSMPSGPETKGGTWNPLGKAVTLARKLSKWNLASKSRQSLQSLGQQSLGQ